MGERGRAYPYCARPPRQSSPAFMRDAEMGHNSLADGIGPATLRSYRLRFLTRINGAAVTWHAVIYNPMGHVWDHRPPTVPRPGQVTCGAFSEDSASPTA